MALERRQRPTHGMIAIGSVIAGRYRVISRIGRGGMGSVYELTHETLDRQFAAKILARDLVHDDVALARFRREADIIAALRHPNIVDIMDWALLDDGTPCIIMEYLHGESLATRIKTRGPLPWPAIARIGRQVLSALAVAHREGIVHRDLKPDNIFLAESDALEEVAKLLDFGISKVRDSNTVQTQDTALLGTPAYMSPEQADARSSEIDYTTDLWAMGAILYEMAAGQSAFRGQSVPSLLYQICHQDPEPLERFRPDLPPGFLHVIGRAMNRERSHRFPGASDMQAVLREVLGDGGLPRAGSVPEYFDQGDITGPIVPSLDMPVGSPHTPFGYQRVDTAQPAAGLSHNTHPGALPRNRSKRLTSMLLAAMLLAAGVALGLLVAGSGDSDAPVLADLPPVDTRDAAVPADVVGNADAAVAVDAAADAAATPETDTRTEPAERKGRRKRGHKKPERKKPERKRGEPVNPFGATP